MCQLEVWALSKSPQETISAGDGCTGAQTDPQEAAVWELRDPALTSFLLLLKFPFLLPMVSLIVRQCIRRLMEDVMGR